MNMSEEGGKKVITLSKAFDSAAKVLSYINFFAFSCFTILLFRALWKELDGRPVFILVVMELVGLIVVMIGGYRFLRRATWKEILMIDKDHLIVKKGSLVGMKTFDFPISELSRFRFLSKQDLTPHPLAGQSMDYLGFDTEQKLVNEVHGDDLMAFDYRGKYFSFGQNTASWEYDEIADLVMQVSGRDIRGEA